MMVQRLDLVLICPGGDILATGGVGDGPAAGKCPHHVQVRGGRREDGGGHRCPLGTLIHHDRGWHIFLNCLVGKSEITVSWGKL